MEATPPSKFQLYSEFLQSHSVDEVHESGTGISLLLVVAVSETSFVVGLLSSEDLDLIELANEELDELSSTLLESWDSLSLSVGLKLLLNALKVSYCGYTCYFAYP